MVATFLRPDADSSDGSWLDASSSNTNLYASVDESTFDDADYIRSSIADGDTVRLRLSDPLTGVAAPLIVRYRVKSEGFPAQMYGMLTQSTSTSTGLIAYWELEPTSSFATNTYTLSAAEFALITDFNDLYVSFVSIAQAPHLTGNIDLNFQAGKYYEIGVPEATNSSTNYLSCTRASAGTAKNSGGAWVSFGNDTLRITDLGLLVEDSRINYLLNSATPITQTTGSLGTGSYTLWVEGSGSALASGGTATITGAASATDGSPNTFTVTGAGTVIVTVTGTLDRFQLEDGSFASSFIATTITSATRAADVVTCTGNLSTILTALPQTSLIDFRATATLVKVLLGSNTTDFSAVQLPANDTQFQWVNAAGSGTSFGTLGNSLTWSGGAKIGLAQASGDISIVGGAGTVITDTIASAFTAPAFRNPFLTTNGAYGYYRRLTVWNSKLADATLQALTAP